MTLSREKLKLLKLNPRVRAALELKTKRHAQRLTEAKRVALESQITERVTGSRVSELRGSLLDLQRNQAREVVCTGPAGTGKSIATLHKLHTNAEAYPNLRILILRKTRASLTESGMATFEDKVLPEDHPARFGARGQRIERKNRSAYNYPNGSIIVLGGMDEATRLFSTEWDLIYWMECNEGSEAEWESLLRALRSNRMPYQQLMGDCNPDVPHHWIQGRKRSGALVLLDTRHEDNPALWDAEAKRWTPFGAQYIATLDKLTGVRRERLRFGRWVAAEGMVYDTFDSKIHVIPSFAIPDSWTRFRSIDFGYTNPFVCQWWAVDPDGRMYLYREIYMTRRLVEQHAGTINTSSASERIRATVCDHDAEDRATLAAKGIPNIAAQKAISNGIQAVQSRLAVQKDGKARLYIFEDALIERDDDLLEGKKPYCTAMEIPEYVYPKGKDGKPLKEVPLDLNNHGMDTMRYAVMYMDNNPKPLPRTKSRGWEY
jgi:PBSX family phage terminase large subunit